MRIDCLKKGAKGFSLVELMVVVAIIGVLAALAVPRFQNFQAKAKQSEARNNLSHIYTLQMSYSAENDVFVATAALPLIGFTVDGGMIRYGYTSVGGAATFTATAAATSTNNIRNGCGAIDTWTITQAKILTNTINCAQ
jgi:type IV pilus assembly protein PilA